MTQRSRVTRAEVVVIGCCVALGLLTLGAAGKGARRLALEQACLSNVEVLMTAWLWYADEHDSDLVQAFPTPGSGWVRQARFPWNAPVMPPLEKKLEAIQNGSLFPYVGGDLNAYHCPADPRLNDPNQLAFGSYSIAGGANGQDGPAHNYVAATRLHEIRPSARYVFVEEPDPRGENFGCWEMHFNPLYWRDGLAMWHEESTTLGFLDGHGDVHRWHDQSLIDYSDREMHGPAGDFPFQMTPPAEQMRDIQFMRDGFPCQSTY